MDWQDKILELERAQMLIDEVIALLESSGNDYALTKNLLNRLDYLAYGATSSIAKLIANLEEDNQIDDSWLDRAIDEKRDREFGVDKDD